MTVVGGRFSPVKNLGTNAGLEAFQELFAWNAGARAGREALELLNINIVEDVTQSAATCAGR
jgi:hypothetical protein